MLLMVQGRTERMEIEEGGRARDFDIIDMQREVGKSEGVWKGGKKGIWATSCDERGGEGNGANRRLSV